MLNEFITYLNEQVGQPYVWGAQHLKLTPSNYVSTIQRKEDDATHESNAINFCHKAFVKGAKVLYAYDCSGLGMYWLQNTKKLYSHDKNANGMMGACTIVSGKPKRGYWLFRLSGNRATHIGYMVDDTYCVHAKGRAYGVVKEKYKSSYWHKIGIPDIFAKDISGNEVSTAYTFTRKLQYGKKGEDVKDLKKALYAKGYGGLSFTNGNFLSSTQSIVKKFQKDHGLTPDGVVGKETVLALGCLWADSDKYVFTRQLKYGCKGEDVKELKKLLLAKGYGGLTLTNGNFYNSTQALVKKFQKDRGLSTDGVVGKDTYAALGAKYEL